MEAEEKLLEKQQFEAKVKAFRALTTLLGKLGIAKHKFVINHDERVRNMGFQMPMPRPPWKEGIQYGLSLGEAHTWVKRYIAKKSETK